MAPVPPPKNASSARTLRAQRISGQIHPLLPSKVFRPNAQVSDSFLQSKRDKRLMKHSLFVSRISASSSKITKSVAGRRRRPKNKLASLAGMVDALPDLDDAGAGGAAIDSATPVKVRHRSLRSKKGALRRKEVVVRGEMQRFGVNMAQLSGGIKGERGSMSATLRDSSILDDQMLVEKTNQDAKGMTSSAPSSRWAVLRGYISATMEQNPAFVPEKSK